MFEGIVRGLAKVERVASEGRGRRIAVDLTGLVSTVPLGGSVAVNGVCLTSVEAQGLVHQFDVIPETLAKTNLGRLATGDRVNVELPLAWGGAVNGHLVQGHIDTTAEVVARTVDRGDARLTFRLPSDHARFLIAKGSVAVDGVSLTLVEVDRAAGSFSVAVIPYTLAVTTLGFRLPGDHVNIETDHHAKLVYAAVGPLLDELASKVENLAERLARLEG